jgi:lysophospholipase L1-like esterase
LITRISGALVPDKLPSGKQTTPLPRGQEKLMHRIATTVAAAIAVTAAALTGAGPAFAAHRAAPAPAYYLSLGDSLAQGVQPNAKGVDVETNQGYPDQLFTALHLGNPLLHLVKLGCPGETTATMINGGICKYPGGAKSQLAAAVAFLQAHLGHVQLVTIDIGANDLNPCLVLSNPVNCLTKVFKKLLPNLGKIMATLRAAGGTSVPMIGMTYYDPELAGWLKGGKARTLAESSVLLANVFGNDLRSVYKKFGAPVASEYKAFQTADLKDMVTLPAFGKVPRDVALICSYTWECAPKPVGPNEHANVLGYGVIANTFLKVIVG